MAYNGLERKESVRWACIHNNWFTCGDNAQYAKVLDAAKNQAPIERLAAWIWLCSDGVSEQEIADVLCKVLEEGDT